MYEFVKKKYLDFPMLISFLQAKFAFREIPWDVERFPNREITAEECRAIAKDPDLVPEYRCFAIEWNDASEVYYHEIRRSLFPDMIYVIFEEKSFFCSLTPIGCWWNCTSLAA